VRETDADGLDALFEGLSDEDRHHRFFNLCHPDRKCLEQMTRSEDEGGYRLVAVVSGPYDELVAEAGYAILPDGDGEFALTVALGWRGWLGTYLLNAIVAAATARGVPNLQADILLDNPRMLALVSHHGHISLSRGALSEVRVAIDAAQPARRQADRTLSPQNATAGPSGRRVAMVITWRDTDTGELHSQAVQDDLARGQFIQLITLHENLEVLPVD
jgi:hypothetical protein